MNHKLVIVCLTVAAVVCRAQGAESAKKSDAPAKVTAAVSTNADEVVAIVNGKEIKRKELEIATQAIRMQFERAGRSLPASQLAQFEHDVLDEMISRELVLQEGKAHPPTNLTARVDEQMTAIKTQIGGEDKLKDALKESGITPAEYTERLRDNITIQETMKQVVERQAKVTPEDIKAFYDKNTKEFQVPETAHASHILIRVPRDASDADKAAKKAQIEAIRSLINNGEKFADVAKKNSEDPGSKDKGGDLGFFPRGAMVPEFDEVAFTIETNKLSDIVTTQFGYHIIIVAERKPAHLAPLDEAKTNIERYLQMQKGQEVAQKYAKELRAKAKVEVLLKSVAKAAPVPAAAGTMAQPAEVEAVPVAAPAK